MPRMTWVLWAVALRFWVACTPRGTVSYGSARELLESVEMYRTEARPNGVLGGDEARRVERALLARLEQRGDEAEPDGALSQAALWLLNELYAGRAPSAGDASQVALRFGFVGNVLGLQGVSPRRLEPSKLDPLFDLVPRNYRVTRYGIATAKDGAEVAIVLGNVEASLEDIPRRVEPGARVRLAGHVAQHYERVSVFVTDTHGKVRETKFPSREVDLTVEFSDEGTYQLELMGYGEDGPMVLVNVPVQVGRARASERQPHSTPTHEALTSEQAEARLLELLNEERRKHGLSPLVADSELKKVALGHSKDMELNGFVSHVSPTTGSPEQRARAAGLRLARLGECVAVGQSPDMAHAALMASPAHRGAMLDPLFSHVGVGVAFRRLSNEKQLIVTLLFARRPRPEEAHQDARSLIATIQAQRRERSLPPLRPDPALRRVAEAALEGYVSQIPPSPREAARAAERALQAEANRRGGSMATCTSLVEILDRIQLADVPLLANPNAAELGVAVTTLTDEKGPRLAVFLVATADGGKKELACH